MAVLKKQRKDIITLVIGKLVQVAISIASIKILTEILTVEEVGNYYLLLAILTFLNFTFLNPFGQYYGRHIIAWEKSKNLLNATVVLICMRLLGIFIALFFSYGVFRSLGYNTHYDLLEFMGFIFIALFAGTQMVFISAINTLGERVLFIKTLTLTLFLGLLGSLLIVSLWNKSGMNWLYGIVAAQLICLIPTYRYLVHKNRLSCSKIKSALNKGRIRKVLYFIIPITITLFLQWGQNASYRLIVEAKYSIEVLAFMAVGFSVSSAIFGVVEGLATQYFNPIFLRKINRAKQYERTEAWNNLADYMFPIYISFTIFVVATAPYLVTILVASKFHEAYIFTMLGAFIEFFRVVTNLVYLVSQSEMKTKTTIIPYAIGALVSVAILYIVDFNSQLWVMAVVLAMSQGIVFVLLFLSMRKLLPIKVRLNSIRKVLFLSMPYGCLYWFTDYSMSNALIIVTIATLYLMLSLYWCIRTGYKEHFL